MTKVFFIQMLNTSFLLMIANSHLEKTPLSFISILNNDPDFTAQWFVMIGDSLVKT